MATTPQPFWQQVTELFERALEVPAGDRAEFLKSACADPQVLHEVKSLLAEHEADEGFLESPAVASVADQITENAASTRIGKQLGQYHLTEVLGTGGMGEVYLARDKLGRNVALKLLTQKFVGDGSGNARLQREARTLLALNHPHIVTIYDIDQVEGVYYIANELVEGETFRERLNKGPMRLRDVLDIAIQVAMALAAAHEKGIVHRDIKPENIMIRRDGFVKVLDFGVAKLNHSDSLIESPGALNQAHTAEGTIVGTAPYMSPEQARGLKVDARTDIWSLGVVMYEAIAGSKPFSGETTPEVLNAVLHKAPVSLNHYVTEAPEMLGTIVSRSLTKEREARYESANELMAALRELSKHIEFAELTGAVTGEPWITQRTNVAGARTTHLSTADYVVGEIKRHRFMFAVGLVALLAAVVGLGVYVKTRSTRVAGQAPPFSDMNISRLTTSGKITHTAISPDGRYVASVVKDADGNSVWIKQLGAAGNARVAGPALTEYISVTFAPDGNSVYYIALDHDKGESTLYRTAASGGSPVIVANDIYPIGVSPDGKQIAFIRLRGPESTLVVADADGANQHVVATRHKPDFFELEWNAPAWSSDGKRIACPVRLNDSRGHYETIISVNPTDGTQTPVSAHRWNYVGQPVWLSDGKGLLLTASDGPGSPMQVWHVGLPSGVATRITHDLSNYHNLSLTADASRLVAVQVEDASNIWVASDADAGNARQVSADIGSLETLAWTRDGQIVYRSNAGGNGADIWIMKADGSNAKQLTVGARVARGLAVTPDGRQIIFSSDAGGQFNLWRVGVDGGNLRQLTTGDGEFYPQCTPDGQWVIYQHDEVVDPKLWKVAIGGGQPAPLTTTRAQKPAVSPDGRMIAYSYLDIELKPSRWGIGIVSVDGGERLRRFDFPPTVSYRQVRWSPDGRAIAFLNSPGGRSDIWLQPLDGSPPKQLTNFKAEQILAFDWSLDGRSLAFVRNAQTSDAVLIEQARR